MNAMDMASVNSMGGPNDAFAPRLVLNTNPDPPSHTIVTFGAGVQSKQLDAATASSPYGAFHVPTSAFPVGSGQFLLGGFGFIGRKYGLAMDNLVEAEIVLADGRIVWVGEGGRYGGEWKEGENPDDVWWGIRGAGPSLGVVTRFRAKAYYVPSVYAGNLI
jgi:FAD/FMN-containing dehydrogenase